MKVNLDSLRGEIQGFLESRGIAVFHGCPRGSADVPSVYWDTDRHPDYHSFLAAAEAAGLAQDTIILLGQMTVSLAGLPLAGDPCRVIAWPSERDGRKLIAGSALLGPGDEVLAAARAVWVTVPRPAPALTAEGAS